MNNLILTNDYLLLNHYMVQDRLLYYNRLWIIITVRDIRFSRILDEYYNKGN